MTELSASAPDWRKLAAIPWSAQVAQVCAALGHTEILVIGYGAIEIVSWGELYRLTNVNGIVTVELIHDLFEPFA